MLRVEFSVHYSSFQVSERYSIEFIDDSRCLWRIKATNRVSRRVERGVDIESILTNYSEE